MCMSVFWVSVSEWLGRLTRGHELPGFCHSSLEAEMGYNWFTVCNNINDVYKCFRHVEIR